jgi:hypothetical protein
MWKNTKQPDKATDDNMAHAPCMLGKFAMNTDTQYVMLTAFQRKKCLCERVSVLRYSTPPVYAVPCAHTDNTKISATSQTRPKTTAASRTNV